MQLVWTVTLKEMMQKKRGSNSEDCNKFTAAWT